MTSKELLDKCINIYTELQKLIKTTDDGVALADVDPYSGIQIHRNIDVLAKEFGKELTEEYDEARSYPYTYSFDCRGIRVYQLTDEQGVFDK